MDFRQYTIEELVALVRSGRQSARSLTAAALSNIERANPVLNAFCSVNAAAALAEAEQVDARLAAGDPVGPLAGMPLGVKDLEDARGYVTTYGSALALDAAPATEDSVLVARLRAAGCVVVGKTNTPEYGHKGVTDNVPFGFTRNPWHTDHSAGGSSGGSAAARAAGLVPIATGSDGGGSIRIPASVCGFTGFKASQGRVPLGGASAPGANVLAVRGPMTLRARDLALALDAIVGDEMTDIYALPHPGYAYRAALDHDNRPAAVVWSATLGYATADAEVLAACESFVARLETLGVAVTRSESIFPADPNPPWWTLWSTLRARAQEHLRDTPDWDQVDRTLRATIEHGMRVRGTDYARAMDACHYHNIALESAFAGSSFILSPTCAGLAPEQGAVGGLVNGTPSPNWIAYTAAINMTRNPAGTICVGYTRSGLPIGLQVIGRQRDDLGVLKTLCYFEDLAGARHNAPAGIAGSRVD
ncbi:MAG: amidase [Pseudomonadales bacterium]